MIRTFDAEIVKLQFFNDKVASDKLFYCFQHVS